MVAVVVLVFVLARAASGRYAGGRTVGMELCRAYWSFVVGLWVVLFFVVYL